MNEKRLKDIRELIKTKREVISDEEYKAIIEKYKMDHADPRLTENAHRIIVGRAAKLLEAVIWNGGTEDEVKIAVINTMICMDSVKHKLDWERWKLENGTPALIEKYVTGKKEHKD